MIVAGARLALRAAQQDAEPEPGAVPLADGVVLAGALVIVVLDRASIVVLAVGARPLIDPGRPESRARCTSSSSAS